MIRKIEPWGDDGGLYVGKARHAFAGYVFELASDVNDPAARKTGRQSDNRANPSPTPNHDDHETINDHTHTDQATRHPRRPTRTRASRQTRTLIPRRTGNETKSIRKNLVLSRAKLNHSPPLRHGQYFSSFRPSLAGRCCGGVSRGRLQKMPPTLCFSQAAPREITVVPVIWAFFALRSVP
jgi:hypothetical protein